MEPIRELQRATHFKQVRGPTAADPKIVVDDMLMPCSPDSAGALSMRWIDVPSDKLLESPVTMV